MLAVTVGHRVISPLSVKVLPGTLHEAITPRRIDDDEVELSLVGKVSLDVTDVALPKLAMWRNEKRAIAELRHFSVIQIVLAVEGPKFTRALVKPLHQLHVG